MNATYIFHDEKWMKHTEIRQLYTVIMKMRSTKERDNYRTASGHTLKEMYDYIVALDRPLYFVERVKGYKGNNVFTMWMYAHAVLYAINHQECVDTVSQLFPIRTKDVSKVYSTVEELVCASMAKQHVKEMNHIMEDSGIPEDYIPSEEDDVIITKEDDVIITKDEEGNETIYTKEEWEGMKEELAQNERTREELHAKMKKLNERKTTLWREFISNVTSGKVDYTSSLPAYYRDEEAVQMAFDTCDKELKKLSVRAWELRYNLCLVNC